MFIALKSGILNGYKRHVKTYHLLQPKERRGFCWEEEQHFLYTSLTFPWQIIRCHKEGRRRLKEQAGAELSQAQVKACQPTGPYLAGSHLKWSQMVCLACPMGLCFIFGHNWRQIGWEINFHIWVGLQQHIPKLKQHIPMLQQHILKEIAGLQDYYGKGTQNLKISDNLEQRYMEMKIWSSVSSMWVPCGN